MLHGEVLTFVAVALFLVTLILVISQPRGLSIGVTALAGAIVALSVGVDRLVNVATVWGIVWNATITFVAVIIISLILDRIGFFEWAALYVLRLSRGSAIRAFVYLLVLGALVASVFANDGAALILTPIVYQQTRVLGFDRRRALPFVMAAGFIADTTSLPFVVSNLVNIVTASFFHIGFISYTMRMAPIDIVSFLASLVVLVIYYRRSLPRSYDLNSLAEPGSAIRDRRLFRIGWVVLAVLLAGYILSEPLNFPVSIPASGVALLFLIAASRSDVLSSRTIVREAPWRIVVFSVGMYLVVYGLYNAGLTSYLSHGLRAASHHGPVVTSLVGGFGAGRQRLRSRRGPTSVSGSPQGHRTALGRP